MRPYVQGSGLNMAYRCGPEKTDSARPLRSFNTTTMPLQRQVMVMRLHAHPAAGAVLTRRAASSTSAFYKGLTNDPRTHFKDPRFPSLGIRTPFVCVIAAHDRGSVCNVRHVLPRPRRSLGYLARDALSHRGRQLRAALRASHMTAHYSVAGV